MPLFSIACSLVLASYIAVEALRSPAEYRELKQAVDSGVPGAQKSFYFKILWFEWITAVLAFAALRFVVNNLDPGRLELSTSSFGSWWLSFRKLANHDFIYGAGVGLLIAVLFLFFILRISRRKATTAKPVPQPKNRLSKFLPDFSYLLPHSALERWLFAAVAVSAGICEEVVFRAWLLTMLHHSLHLYGWVLVLAGAAVFGALHVYQGAIGVISAVVLAVVLSGVYVGAGTLLAPIAVHVLLDLRWAVVPNVLGPIAEV